MGAEDGCGQAEQLVSAAPDPGLEGRVEREPRHAAALECAGAGRGAWPGIGHSVRCEPTRSRMPPRTLNGRAA
jgi:hypothetical protein